MRPEHCCVLVPVAKSIEPETEEGLRNLTERGYPVRLLKGGSQVDLVRSSLASQAVRDGFAETLWIDSDVVFNVDDVDRLRENQVGIVAGLYPKKDRNEFACQFSGVGSVVFGDGGGLMKMDGVGMGFTLIRREVYEAIGKTLPACDGNYDPALKVTPYFLPVIEETTNGPRYLSEDYSFGYRAKKAGFEVWADTRIKLGHVHRHVKTWDDLVPRQIFGRLEVKVG